MCRYVLINVTCCCCCLPYGSLSTGKERFGCVYFEGTFFVNTETDNDYAGFVFSFQSNRKFYLVAWKNATERYWSGSNPEASAGLSLKVS